MNANANYLLYGGIRNLLRCDEAEVVEEIARYVISQHTSLRLVSKFVEKTRNTPLPALLTLLAWTRSVLVVHQEGPLSGAAWMARLSNERHALEPVIALAPDLPWTEFKFRSRISIRSGLKLTIRNLRSIPQVYKIARRLHRQFESFKAMRVVELLGYYARYLELFRQGNFRLALTSNHSNPHGIAFNLAARKCGIPVVLISHGMPVRPVARLEYDLAVVHCEAARQTYVAEDCQIDRVLIHGRKQDHVVMREGSLPPQINIGVFLCKDVNEQGLNSLVENLISNDRVARILIRPHPKNLWPHLDSWISSHEDARLYKSCEATVMDDLKGIDVVFGGNSSVLIEAVTAGVPSAYIDHLDHGSADLHGFVAAGLIYRDDVVSDLNNILRFYQRPEWCNTLRSFANIDEDEATVLANAVGCIRQLIIGTQLPLTRGKHTVQTPRFQARHPGR